MIEQIQVSSSESESKRFIYIGDGMNDFCPTIKLASEDFVLPRKEFPLSGRILKNSHLVKAKVCEWNDSEDMAKILGKLIECISNEDKISPSTT